MRLIYAQESFTILDAENSIFLAGPTPRSKDVISWRNEALEYLKDNFKGTVFIPEFRTGISEDALLNYSDQIEWEERSLTYCSIILFWIPRNMKTLPGMTTNDEWGVWKKSGKVVLGFPNDAEKIAYQEYYAKKYNVPMFNKLNESLDYCINKLKT